MASERGQRRVVCAACRLAGKIVVGPRHMDSVMRTTIHSFPAHEQALWWRRTEEGFIDQWGVFMNRQEAWVVASEAGQVLYRVGGDDSKGGTLYSENLY